MLLANLMPLVTTTSRCSRRRGTLRSGCGGTVHFCCWTYGFTHYMAHVIPSPIDLELNLELFSHADVYTKQDNTRADRPSESHESK